MHLREDADRDRGRHPDSTARRIGGVGERARRRIETTPQGREHEPIATVIDRLPEIFDPWRTPAEFLPWLASWVALEFPTHPVADGGREYLWDEYQRRKVTAEMARIYRQRGLKDGLNRFLDLYTVTSARPRIAVDDGSRLLALDPRPGRGGRIATVLSRNPSVYRARHPGTRRQELVLAREGPVHPTCLAIAPDHSLFLGDLGTLPGWKVFTPSLPATPTATIPAAVWRYADLATAATATPERIEARDAAGRAITLKRPVALVVDAGPPSSVFILDRDEGRAENNAFLYRVDPAQWTADDPDRRGVAQSLGPIPGTRWPVAMALDGDRRLVILDRGGSITLGATQRPRLLRFAIPPAPPPRQPDFAQNLLPDDVEPLSLLVLETGDLLIGDGARQSDASPGDLVHVQRQGDGWGIRRLSAELARVEPSRNPLVAPVAMAAAGDGSVYVADLGLKPYRWDVDRTDPVSAKPFLRHRTEPAAIYRVVLAAQPPEIVRISETGRLVQPTGLALDASVLFIADQGEGASQAVASKFSREWRAEPHELGVVVHFPPEPATTIDARRQILRTISSIVAREKPAHAGASYAFSYVEVE